jgi:hypothetical protein
LAWSVEIQQLFRGVAQGAEPRSEEGQPPGEPAVSAGCFRLGTLVSGYRGHHAEGAYGATGFVWGDASVIAMTQCAANHPEGGPDAAAFRRPANLPSRDFRRRNRRLPSPLPASLRGEVG